MADYISREAITEYLMGRIKNYLEMGDRLAIIPLNFAMAHIKSLPAADVAPVVHGRWEMRPTGMATDTGPEYKAYCTVCNEPNKQYQPPYCPHCGAKMDLEGETNDD